MPQQFTRKGRRKPAFLIPEGATARGQRLQQAIEK
jgi:hypothetical protein